MRVALHRHLVAAVLVFGGLFGVVPSAVRAAPVAAVQTVQYFGPGPGYYRGPPPGYYRRPYPRPFYRRPFYRPGPGFYGPRRGYYGRPYYGRRFYR